MSYTYIVGLRLANPKPGHCLCEPSVKELIYTAVKEYNAVCSNAKNNPKRIAIREIGKTELILSLNSQIELSTPGKALRSFSQILLKDPFFKDTFIFGKQLFTSYDVTADKDADNQTSHISSDDIDDTLFLTSLISYFLNKRDADTATYLRKRKAISKMKILAYECGIVESDNG